MFYHNKNTKCRRLGTWILLCAFLITSTIMPDEAHALAPWLGSERASVRQEWVKAYANLEGRIVWARSDDAKAILERHGSAKAVLRPEGKIIVSESVKNNDLELLRAIIHEEVEAVMQIIARRGHGKYSDIKNIILSDAQIRETYQLLCPSAAGLPADIRLNDMVAKGCELIIISKKKYVTEAGLTPAERAFRDAIEIVMARHRFNYFTDIFWEPEKREREIRIAFATGELSAEVADSPPQPSPASPSHFIQRLFQQHMHLWDGNYDIEEDAADWFRRIEIVRIKRGKEPKILDTLHSLLSYPRGASHAIINAVRDINIALVEQGREAVSVPAIIEMIGRQNSSFSMFARALGAVYAAMIKTGATDKMDLSVLEKSLDKNYDTLINTDKSHVTQDFDGLIDGMMAVDEAFIIADKDPHYLARLERLQQDLDVLVRGLRDGTVYLKSKWGDMQWHITRYIVNPLLVAQLKLQTALIKKGKTQTSVFKPEYVIRREGIEKEVLESAAEFIEAAVEAGKPDLAIEWIKYIEGTVPLAVKSSLGWPNDAQGLIRVLGKANTCLLAKGHEEHSMELLRQWATGIGTANAACAALADIDCGLIAESKEPLSVQFLQETLKDVASTEFSPTGERDPHQSGLLIRWLCRSLLQIDRALKENGRDCLSKDRVTPHQRNYLADPDVAEVFNYVMFGGKKNRRSPDKDGSSIEKILNALLARIQSGSDVSWDDVEAEYKKIHEYYLSTDRWGVWPLRRRIDAAMAEAGKVSDEDWAVYDEWLGAGLPAYNNVFNEYLSAPDRKSFIASFDRNRPIDDHGVYSIVAYTSDAGYESRALGTVNGRELRELILPRENGYLTNWSIRWEKAEVSADNRENTYCSLLRCALMRYQEFSRERRVESSFIVNEIVRIARENNRQEFEGFFETLVSVIDPADDTRPVDLSVLFGDVMLYHPELKETLYHWLQYIAAVSLRSSARTSETALKVMRGAEVGQVVLVSMESNWKNSRMGGVSLFVTDFAKALTELGIDVTVVTPLFANEHSEAYNKCHLDEARTQRFDVLFGTGTEDKTDVYAYQTVIDGVRAVFLQNYEYMHSLNEVFSNDRGRLRFARVLSQGALQALEAYNIYPKVIVSNDWGSGYIGLYSHSKFASCRFDGINLSDDPHFTWEEDGRQEETRTVTVIHSGYHDHQGRINSEAMSTSQMTLDRILYDLRLNVDAPYPGLFTPGRPDEINPLNTSVCTADEAIGVSNPYLLRMVREYDNPEFGRFAWTVMQKISSGGRVAGIPNAFDEMGRQRTFFKKMLTEDDEVKTHIANDFANREWQAGEEEYKDVLARIMADPSQAARSLLEIGREKERRLFAKMIFEYIQPVQKKKLQKKMGLNQNEDAFIYSMLHRVDEQKGYQLLINYIWDKDDQPEFLRHFPGQLFEGMHIKDKLDDYAQGKLRAHAERYGLRWLTAVDVLMAFHDDIQFVIAGSSQSRFGYFADDLRALAARYPGRFVYLDKFVSPSDEDYELIYSGSTVFGMPSRFEPGGLGQREAHSYGVPSLTTRRDGLLDTMLTVTGEMIPPVGNKEPYTFKSGFDTFNPIEWFHQFRHMRWVFCKDPEKYYGVQYVYEQGGPVAWKWPLWDELRYQALIQDNRWINSAGDYIREFRKITDHREIPAMSMIEIMTAYNVAKKTGGDILDTLAAAGYILPEATLWALKNASFTHDQELISREEEISKALEALYSRNGKEVSGQIGKVGVVDRRRVKFTGKGSKRKGTCVITDVYNSKKLGVSHFAKSNIDPVRELKRQLDEMYHMNDDYKKIILGMLALFEKSPPAGVDRPDLYTFKKPIADVLGFALPEGKAIVLHENLAENPVALFHEIGHYLIDTIDTPYNERY
ncbi:MAG: glycogen/starch synthase, partial [Candidatus Omnitrophica bacterium]|nr:glycogen/starch synthase [Candidatus Omnitrophota bacterium]